MIFDIIRSTVGVDKWGALDGKRTLSFEVVPNGRELLEIGDQYVLSSSGYHRMRFPERERVTAKVFVTSDRSYVEWDGVDLGEGVIGWASVHGDGDLTMTVLLEPSLFDEMYKFRVVGPDTATIHVGIENLEFGLAMDGS